MVKALAAAAPARNRRREIGEGPLEGGEALVDWVFINLEADISGWRIAFLRQLLPAAGLISAKGVEFDSSYQHVTYDLAACVRAAEEAGFRGIYSVELWSGKHLPAAPVEAVASIAREIQSELAP
jgi:hypothetical protein